jgi:dihydropteroate synthase
VPIILQCAGKTLDLSKTCVMGTLNVTPDSFSDGGDFFSRERALERAFAMVEEGVDIIDIGGESTRPGALAVSAQEEIDRVVPVIESLATVLPVPLSVDTSKPAVMRAAVEAGAGMINDVYALRMEGALDVVRSLDVPVCLMHMQGEPRSMQDAPRYDDVVAEVSAFLSARRRVCEQAGVQRRRLIIDPGFGFGKTLAHNLALLRDLHRLCRLGVPVLVGISRKSMIGSLLNRAVNDRLYGSLAAAVIASLKGASILRVHDVRPTVDALAIVEALSEGGVYQNKF